MFKTGDVVFHKTFKTGVITKDELESSQFVVVKFDNDQKNEKLIVKSYITLVKKNDEQIVDKSIEIIKEDKVEESINSGIHIIPSGYANSDFLSTNEKEVLTRISKNLSSGFAAFGTNPIGPYIDRKIGYIIDPSRGVIVYKIFSSDNIDVFLKNYKTINYAFKTAFADKIESWLLNTKQLTTVVNNKKVLLFPLRVIALFHNIYYKDILREISGKTIDFEYICFRSFLNNKYSDISEIIKSLESISHLEKPLSSNTINLISSKILPEYSVIIYENDVIDDGKSDHLKDTRVIDESILERKYKAIMLDEEQIKIINSTKSGHYLTLANPGTGKSVILISKAYRLACLFDEEILVTCYNKNLNEKYQLLKEESGFHDKHNLSIKTFNALVLQLLKEHGYWKYSEAEVIDHDKNAEVLYDLLSRGIVKKQYKAILIDEVQLFNSNWIDICYLLLKKPVEQSYFELYGDLNQDVRNRKARGMASWQNTVNIPSFQGRVRVFTKNYRNTYAISEYLNHMMILINNRILELKCKIDKDIAMLSSVTSKKGPKPIVINRGRQNLSKNVAIVIKNLFEKNHIDYNDMAVLFPFRQNSGLRYYPLESVKSILIENNIPFSDISGSNSQKLIDSYGVTLSTIDSTLGLDFRVVIIAGLFPVSYFFSEDEKSIKMTNFAALLSHHNKEIINYYIKASRQLYAAASRAREGLIIINDLDEDSVFYELINLRKGEKLYETK